jgi:hypothetical protein
VVRTAVKIVSMKMEINRIRDLTKLGQATLGRTDNGQLLATGAYRHDDRA